MSSFNSKTEHSHLFIQMVNLKYKNFIQMIQELNELAQYFIDNDGSSLQFNIIKGTDATFLWKITVRIECSKFNSDATDIKEYRILRLNQFINLYHSIKQQADTMKSFTSQETTNSNNNNNNGLMNGSRLYDSIVVQNNSASKEEEEFCCICMERKPDSILQCTHSFCESCIEEWQVTKTTCPICRCVSDKNDAFILADKPDYYKLQDEMSKSLFEITNKRSSPKSRIEISSTSDSD